MRLSRPIAAGGAVVAGVLLIGGIAYFQPQKLFINERVNEPTPASTVSAGSSAGPADTVLGQGSIQSLEHQSSGTVILIQAPGGQRVLRFENLSTSNGPDLRVYLSSKLADSNWYGYDLEYVDLGPLKGNLGNQNYTVPDGVDLSRYRSAVIWCRRFKVGFAVAPLIASGA
jgi:Electron transfer DM13